MNKSLILFAYSEGVGLTYIMAHYSLAIKELVNDFIVVHNGFEQNPGLLLKLKEAKIDLININKISIESYIKKGTIIHCQGFKQVKLIEKIAQKKKAKILITLNAYRNAKFYKKLYILYVMYRFKSIDKWIFSSYFSFLDFKRLGFNKNFNIIPLGIESIDKIQPANQYIDIFNKHKESYSKNFKYIFYAAQFHEHKKHKLLIQTIEHILKSNENFILMLCGSGKLINEINFLVEKNKIRNQVKFLGRIDRNKFLSHMKNATLAVVSSKTETFGHNILEPLVLDIPVVSTPVGIAPEIIKESINGFLSDLTNKQKFNNSILYYCNSKRNVNNKNIRDKFSWTSIAKRYYYAYLSLDENSY